MEDELREAVRKASDRPEVLRAVGEVYVTLDHAIEARRPICRTSGRCCRFEEFGHRLYVTTMELAKFSADWAAQQTPSQVVDQNPSGSPASVQLPVLSSDPGLLAADRPGCPFQVQGMCGVHSLRPFGCRIFFCDPTSTQWQQELYERLHGQFRRLHEELEVPYYYVEWRFALRSLAWVKPSGG